MNEPVDILLLGSGPFAARIAFDLAATAQRLTRMLVAARDPRRLVWVRTAARGRAALFATPARFATASIDLLAEGAAASLLTQQRPRVVVQAASAQASAVIAGRRTGWSALVAEGGLSATAIFQLVVTCAVATAARDAVGPVHVLTHLIHRGLGIDLRERRPQFPDAAFRRYAGTDCLGAGG